MSVLIGTSGWHYADWKRRFYPDRLASAQWLPFYAERFATVELNNAFYRLPERAGFERWRDMVPEDFVFAVKASRYLTHVRRLQDPAEPVARLLERAEGLGSHLGPVLLQLPPTLKVEPARLDATLAAFGTSVRVAVEPRHPSWFVEEVRAMLEHRKAALCVADGGPVEMPLWRTVDWSYTRFHGGSGRPRTCYKQREIEAWSTRLIEHWSADEDVYCFFNNDAHGCALRDARWVAEAFERAGRPVTRVPRAREVHLH